MTQRGQFYKSQFEVTLLRLHDIKERTLGGFRRSKFHLERRELQEALEEFQTAYWPLMREAKFLRRIAGLSLRERRILTNAILQVRKEVLKAAASCIAEFKAEMKDQYGKDLSWLTFGPLLPRWYTDLNRSIWRAP